MVLVVIAMASGIWFSRTCDLHWIAYPIILAVAGVVAGAAMSLLAVKQRRMVVSIALCCAIFAAGGFWSHVRWNWFGVNNIGLFANEAARPVCLRARVRSEPRLLANDEQESWTPIPQTDRTRMVIEVTRIRSGENWKPVTGRIDLVVHARAEHLRSGDQIQLVGKLVQIAPPSNPGQFDFRTYYRTQGKLAIVHVYGVDSIQVTQPAPNWSMSRIQSTLRRNLNRITWEYVAPERAPLASAILLGNREQLTTSRRDLFLMTGTVHLLAISGLHVGILAGSIFLLFRLGLLSRTQFLWLTIAFVIFYAWLVEFRSPVSRAAILIVLYCVGRLRGKTAFSLNWLATAGVIVLLINPGELFQIGSQLSFLAVATITVGKDWVFWPPPEDPLQRLIANTRPWPIRWMNGAGRTIRTAFLVSGLIWLIGLPLVASKFNLVAPVALIVNPILLFPIAIGLWSGLGVLVFGWFLPPLATFCGWICDGSLWSIEAIIGLAEQLPLSHFWTSGPTLTAVGIFYFALIWLMMYPPTKVPAHKLAILGVIWFVTCWSLPDVIGQWQKRGRLNCTFVDVGHGTSVLIESPCGKTFLYDAGCFGSASYGFRNVAGVIWHNRIHHLDAIFVSHADADHFNAIPQLCQKFSIGQVFVTSQMLASSSPSVIRLFQCLKRFGIPIRAVSEESDLDLCSDLQLRVIAPTIHCPRDTESDNSNSLVLLLEYLGRSILLSGDLEAEGMDRLLQLPPQQVDVVMAPHHGSRNSSPEEFMRWSSPEYIVVSAAMQKVDKAVLEQLEDSGAVVSTTGIDGAVTFSVDETGLSFKSFRSAKRD